MEIVPRSRVPMRSTTTAPTARVTGGGGRPPPEANHSEARPPQASIARRTTLCTRGAPGAVSSAAGAASAIVADGFAGEFAGDEQHDGEPAGLASTLSVQHVFACSSQLAWAGFGRVAATRRSRLASTAVSTSCARAQASVSAGDWQQQAVKHCSAVAQPHGLSMQGKARDRSFPASLPAAMRSKRPLAPPAGAVPIGSGRPDATSA